MRAEMIVVGLALLLLGGCREALHRGLEEQEANALLASLREVGIDATKRFEAGRDPTWSIEVPVDQQSAAVRHLETQGLPRRRTQGMSAVLKGGAMVPTPTEERLKEGHLLAEQAVLALEQLEGVALARVQLSLPPRSRPGQPAGVAKASVLIKARPGLGPQLESMRGAIQQLVAGGVDGLEGKEVAVVVQALQPPSPVVPAQGSPPSTRLRVALAISCVMVMGLAALVLLLLVRNRKAALASRAVPEPAAAASRPRLTGSPVPRVTPGPIAAKGGHP